MKILIGTKNPGKIEGARQAFELYFNNVEIEGIPVNSDVGEQPINEEIFLGAKNRVKNLKEYAINNNYDIDTTDGVKVLKESSWGLLRASNTGPNLTLRFEATTKKELKQIQKEFMDVLSKIMNK